MSAKRKLGAATAIVATIACVQAVRASSICQLPDQGGGGQRPLFRRSSELANLETRQADNVALSMAVSVDRVRWWGVYEEGVTHQECPAPASDDFEIRVYEDDGTGLPGALIHESIVTAVDRQATGVTLIDPHSLFEYAEYEYEADLDGSVTLSPGTEYWVSIYSTNGPVDPCYWGWETAPGDDYSASQLQPSEPWEAQGFDSAYCLFDSAGVPAVSAWSVLVTALLLLATGTVVFRRPIPVRARGGPPY